MVLSGWNMEHHREKVVVGKKSLEETVPPTPLPAK